jgi:hypothetical protein
MSQSEAIAFIVSILSRAEIIEYGFLLLLDIAGKA